MFQNNLLYPVAQKLKSIQLTHSFIHIVILNMCNVNSSIKRGRFFGYYADDIILMAEVAATLQALLNLLNSLSNKIGLTIYPTKCISMHYFSRPPAGCRPTIFNINGQEILHISDGSPVIFLGKPIGAFIPRDTVAVELLKQRALGIISSKLAPWQRLDCLKTFFYSSLLFLMRTNQLKKKQWKETDDCITPTIKRTLGLPPVAADEYLYGTRVDGLLEIPLAAEDSDISHIDGGVKLLKSKGPIIRNLAWWELSHEALHRYRSHLVWSRCDYLNSIVHSVEDCSSNNYSSVWIRVRQATTRLGLSWRLYEDERNVELVSGESVVTDRRAVFRTLRYIYRKVHHVTAGSQTPGKDQYMYRCGQGK